MESGALVLKKYICYDTPTESTLQKEQKEGMKMNVEGLDVLDKKILDVLRDNARASFSEIGDVVGLSRVAVKKRIEAMEQTGIIQGYKTVINPTNVPQGVKFIIDVEAVPELLQDVIEELANDKLLRQVYTTTGDCRIHAIGFAQNVNTLEKHVNHLYLRTKGIRRMSWHLLLATIKDVDGGVEYVRYQESEYMESEQ